MNRTVHDSLGKYLDRVLSAEDRVLFEEAVASARASATRAAYIMVWLSCAESLKRKFREFAPRDGTATQVTGEIARKEGSQHAVDKYILEQAKEYGFISNTEHAQLVHVYEMRCVYGHPYETSPVLEQLVAAASVVIENVLSRPTKLRHGYISEQIRLITQDPTFLDDLHERVRIYATAVHPKVDDSLHLYFMRKLWGEIEKLLPDATMAIYVRRGTWFSRAYLTQVIDGFLPDWDVVQDLVNTPGSLSNVLSDPVIFERISEHAQDIVVGKLIGLATTTSTGLRLSHELHAAGVLSERHRERFRAAVKDLALDFLVSSGYPPIYYANKFIEELKRSSWHKQNPAVEALKNVGAPGIGSLPPEMQVQLGNNVLQAAEGNARSAISFLNEISEDATVWPEHFVEGVLAECVVNDEDKVRFKNRHLASAVKVVLKLESGRASAVSTRISERIRRGTLKYRYQDLEDRDDAVRMLDKLGKDEGVLQSLQEALAALESELSDDSE
jgi:hypothetical protein